MLTNFSEVKSKTAKIVVLFPRPRQKRENRDFHVVVLQRNVQKSVMHVQSCCFAGLNQVLFCRPRCRRRSRCLSFLLSLPLRGLFKVMLHETIRNNDFQPNTAL